MQPAAVKPTITIDDLKKIDVTTFKLADFRRAVEAAALMQGLDLTAVVP